MSATMRLDRLLANMGYGSRREVQQLVRDGAVVLDGQVLADADMRLAIGPDLSARMRVSGAPLDPPPGMALMLHKPLGVTCSHKEAGALVYELLPRRWRMREPAISTVGRLDKDTSGLMLIARTSQAAKRLAESFRDRETEKLYWAIVVGVPPKKEGAIDLPLAKRPGARDRETMQVDHEEGLKALTHFREMDRAGRRAALLALWPRTGRTHQLRVHCAEMGCPILGDRKYGGQEAELTTIADPRKLYLHARRITLPHPSGKGELKVQAELPPHFRRTVEAFGFSTTGDRESE